MSLGIGGIIVSLELGTFVPVGFDIIVVVLGLPLRVTLENPLSVPLNTLLSLELGITLDGRLGILLLVPVTPFDLLLAEVGAFVPPALLVYVPLTMMEGLALATSEVLAGGKVVSEPEIFPEVLLSAVESVSPGIVVSVPLGTVDLVDLERFVSVALRMLELSMVEIGLPVTVPAPVFVSPISVFVDSCELSCELSLAGG